MIESRESAMDVITPTIALVAPPLRVEPDGTIRVGSSRITLDFLIEAFQGGMPLEQFVEEFPTTTLPDVYGAIYYYLSHRDELRPYLETRRRRAQAWEDRAKADPRSDDLKAKILARARKSGLRR